MNMSIQDIKELQQLFNISIVEVKPEVVSDNTVEVKIIIKITE